MRRLLPLVIFVLVACGTPPDVAPKPSPESQSATAPLKDNLDYSFDEFKELLVTEWKERGMFTEGVSYEELVDNSKDYRHTWLYYSVVVIDTKTITLPGGGRFQYWAKLCVEATKDGDCGGHLVVQSQDPRLKLNKGVRAEIVAFHQAVRKSEAWPDELLPQLVLNHYQVLE